MPIYCKWSKTIVSIHFCQTYITVLPIILNPLLPFSRILDNGPVAKWAIVQLYQGKNKLHFSEVMMRSTLYYTNRLDFYSARSLKQQSMSRHVAPEIQLYLQLCHSISCVLRLHRWDHTNDYEIDICWFSAKNAALRRKSKDWFHNNE
jgi:hypothetical protein